MWGLKLTPIYCWLVTFISLHSNQLGIRYSAHDFITTSTKGPIKPHLFSLLFIFCLASRGAQAWLEEGRLCPITLCCPRGPLALEMGGRNVMTGHFEGDSVQGHVTLSLTTF